MAVRHITLGNIRLRTIGLSLVLALVVVALPSALLPAASAQEADRGMLNGWWKTDGDPGYVWIGHQGTTVKGAFYLGGLCFDGKEKPYAIDGKLSTTVTPSQVQHTLTGKLWVCTGSPGLIEECGGRLSSAYEATIIDAVVGPNRISGNRVRQGVLDCRPNSAYDGTRSFEFTRHACTEQELEMALGEDYLRSLQRQITEGLDVFVTAHSAARARYGDTFTFENTTWQTSWLQNPYFELRRDFPTAEAFFEHLRQVTTVNPDRWLSARTTAQLMARDLLTQAAPMVERMSAIEEILVEARSALEEIQKLRKDLDACRRANPSAPR